jgi:hypothetical protein
VCSSVHSSTPSSILINTHLYKVPVASTVILVHVIVIFDCKYGEISYNTRTRYQISVIRHADTSKLEHCLFLVCRQSKDSNYFVLRFQSTRNSPGLTPSRSVVSNGNEFANQFHWLAVFGQEIVTYTLRTNGRQRT